MMNLRKKNVIKVLFVALMVLFVGGVFGGADVYAAGPQMHNGGEGDPGDGFDIVSGGGGSNSDEQGNNDIWEQINERYQNANQSVFVLNPFEQNFVMYPTFENGKIIWVFSSFSLERGGK